jgi:adenylate cyclase
MAGLLSFRRFRTRLLVLILGLLAAALGVSYLLVTRANRANAIAHIEQNLAGALRVFWFSVELRQDRLAQSAKVVSADWPMRTLYLQDEFDRHTLRSTLMSYVERLEVPVVTAFDPDGNMLATTMDGLDDEACGPFRQLVQQAEEGNADQAGDFAYLGGRLHVLVVVPLYAPRPNIIGWFGAAFPIDDAFAQTLRQTTQAEVTFVSGPGEAARRVLATTLPPARAQAVAAQMMPVAPTAARTTVVNLDGEPFVTLFTPLGLLGDDPARIALQRSLEAELAPARELENIIALIAVAALVVASVVALGAARSVSRPVQALAAHTEVIAGGDYSARIELDRADELGQLAASFNRMSAGLAERDRVRDLLDKNVSPAVAAQLLRDGAALGGEERPVTILFVDLRGFTSLSERLSPRELIALLNRYLDAMSHAIEAEGGVIDKFIGDAIMALFGAPLAQPDAADRALAAALAMRRALAALNAELAAEQQPQLAFGIGINTASVVAGNIGSHRRLNYSVIGDGVNVASRLQALTRDPAYATDIIVSAATLQAAKRTWQTEALGNVKVKGRMAELGIHKLLA